MEKLDHKKIYKELYKPSGKNFSMVEVPEFNFVMYDGKGSPDLDDFMMAMEGIYGLSYTLKFMLKEYNDFPQFTVMPLEALWWADDISAYEMNRKDEWLWRTMIMLPDFVNAEHFNEAREKAIKKKDSEALHKVRFEKFNEGLSVQILYTGPYSEEAPTIAAMHKHAEEEGYKLRGKHHEIYLSDPRRTAPEKLKTVLRHPVEKI